VCAVLLKADFNYRFGKLHDFPSDASLNLIKGNDMTYLKHILISAALAAFSAVAYSAEKTVLGGDIFEKGSKLSIDEIKTIIVADTEVEQINGNTGGIRRWKNNADGKFVASRQAASGSGTVVTGQGEWKLTETGQYCVQIEWRTRSGGPEQENWCRTLWRLEGVIYLAPVDLAPNRERKYGQIKFMK
jgi:Protein of unknown function (DUF995)